MPQTWFWLLNECCAGRVLRDRVLIPEAGSLVTLMTCRFVSDCLQKHALILWHCQQIRDLMRLAYFRLHREQTRDGILEAKH